MSETVADLTDSIEYDHKIDDVIEGYVFYDDNDRRYAFCVTTYGYMIETGGIDIHCDELRFSKFGQIILYNDDSHISSIHSSTVPDDMFTAMKIIADDN